MLSKKSKLSSIPSLKDDDGKWQLEAKAKADLFVDTWNAKNALPEEIAEQYFSPPCRRKKLPNSISIHHAER